MKARAVGIEIALVVTGGGNRDILERQHRRELAGAARVAHADRPGAAAAVADDAAVEDEVAPAHGRPSPGELVVARANAITVVVELTDRRIRDVEGAARERREL